MKREPVVSSNIVALGYDPDTQVLEVQFLPSKKTGESPVWQYFDVTPVMHATLIRSHSLGRAFAVVRDTCKARKVAIVDPAGVEHPISVTA